MKFNLGDIVSVDNTEYHIVGKIKYKNMNDGKCWDEYRMFPLNGQSEAWLSIDEVYKEYSISKKASFDTSTLGYHLVDEGIELVVGRDGDVDVDTGDKARFYEYEDSTEEKIVSHEIWDDETEVCTGYYLDENEIFFVRHDTQYKVRRKISSENIVTAILVLAVIIYMFAPNILDMLHFTPTIKKYLDKSNSFTYVTSITGEDKQKARVYKAPSYYTVGDAAEYIIDGIDGYTEQVQQDTDEENGSIGILTDKEYCLIYNSEDGDVLAQVSDRKYAYTTDSRPYHSSSHVHSYYKRFYYSSGYPYDHRDFKKTSPYDSYDGDMVYFSSNDYYSRYSNSVRQSSIHSRSSSGGGISSGK